MRILLGFAFLFKASILVAQANPNLESDSHFVELEGSRVHVLEVRPKSQIPQADVYYFHGMGDRASNHMELFNEIASQNYRVLGVDLPSHGLTKGRSINWFSYSDLGKLVSEVDKQVGSPQGPVILSGWSFGGLLALRMAQQSRLLRAHRPIAGLALHAPAIMPRTFFGEWGSGWLDNSVITDNPNAPNKNEWSIRHPATQIPLFGMRIVLEAARARRDLKQAGAQNIVGVNGIPTLIVLGADPKRDRSINTGATIDFIYKHSMVGTTTMKKSNNLGTTVYAGNGFRVLAVDAPHALDWSPTAGGSVRSEASAFISQCVRNFRELSHRVPSGS